MRLHLDLRSCSGAGPCLLEMLRLLMKHRLSPVLLGSWALRLVLLADLRYPGRRCMRDRSCVRERSLVMLRLIDPGGRIGS